MTKRVRVTWQTEETREYTAVIEIPDDADPDEYLDGDSEELIDAEESQDPFPMEFYRTVQEVHDATSSASG